MSDEEDPFTEAEVTDPPDEEALREERRALDQRERGLADFADELDEREAELDDQAKELRRERNELDERAAELDETEATLQEYVNDGVRETVREAVATELSASDGAGRFGRIGSLVLALVGVTLIVGGVLNGFAASIPSVPVVFGSETANLAVTVLLLFSGLAANLAAVAD
jgi:hypothetical protein